jgi:hypothetical protein
MRHDLCDRLGRPFGQRLKLAILAAGELLDDGGGQAALGLAFLARVVA